MNAAESAERVHGSVDRLSRTAHHAVDRVAERAGPAVDRVRNAAEHASEVVGSSIDSLSAMQDEWTASLRNQVRERPFAALGLAIITGLLIGRLTR
jgi:ElaB/YqjD/DUF883 family membrane-anchored ribosome-binding protein